MKPVILAVIRCFLLLGGSFALLATAAADGLVDGRLGTINDKDGYTYVRQDPGKDGKVIATVRKNEHIRVFPNDGHWWRVRTAQGIEGFMHESRIRLLEEPDPAPAPAPGSTK